MATHNVALLARFGLAMHMRYAHEECACADAIDKGYNVRTQEAGLQT